MRRLFRSAAMVMAAGCLLGSVHDASAQRRGRRNRQPVPSARLEAITSLTCTFPVSATGSWDANDAPHASIPSAPSTFTLTIRDIDAQGGIANVTGLGVPSEAIVRLVGSNLHILDIRTTGALAITTVFAEESHDGRLKAVHSRSDYAGGVAGPPDVSQFYGDCAVGAR